MRRLFEGEACDLSVQDPKCNARCECWAIRASRESSGGQSRGWRGTVEVSKKLFLRSNFHGFRQAKIVRVWRVNLHHASVFHSNPAPVRSFRNPFLRSYGHLNKNKLHRFLLHKSVIFTSQFKCDSALNISLSL